MCAMCYAAAHHEDPLVKARYKTEEKLAQFYTACVGADFESGRDVRNARGARAANWLGRFEADFLLAGGLVNDECDGEQHFGPVRMFGSKEDAALHDAEKMALAVAAGVSVTRIVQGDVWGDRHDWRALKRAQLSLAATVAAKGLPIVLLACCGEGDRRYAGHVEALREVGGEELASYACYCWMESESVMAVQHAVVGDYRYWRPADGFSLKGGPTGRFVRAAFAKQSRLGF